MPGIWKEFRGKLRYKIILPFLLLTLIVALGGSAFAFYLVANSVQERFDNRLAKVSLIVNQMLVDQERANLLYLMEIVHAPANENTGAPAVSDGLSRNDAEGLGVAINPYFLQGMSRPGLKFDRLIVVNKQGYSLVDLERVPTSISATGYITNPVLDFSEAWQVPNVLSSYEDEQGDKFAGLIQLQLPGASGADTFYFGTIAPVVLGDEVVGGIIVAMEVQDLVNYLQQRATNYEVGDKNSMVVFYDKQGHAQISTYKPNAGISVLNITPDVIKHVEEADDEEEWAIFDVKKLAGQEYQFSYTPLKIRNTSVGILATALSRQDMMQEWAQARLPLTMGTLLLMFGIIVLGVLIARFITAPLEELATTARAVTAGELDRRSRVRSRDEIGMLATTFNQMTDHLIALFAQVLRESSERAAIVKSIGDGIIVCDSGGTVLSMNRSSYAMLGIDEHAVLPGHFGDLPLVPITEAVFGKTSDDLFALGDYTVRVSKSPIITDDGTYLGDVHVLHNLTNEVKVDRAKSGFIATINHEMRTPLTSMRGNIDMLRHEVVGPLNEEQKPMIETIGIQVGNMVKLVNNMTVIAGLDSGDTKVEIEPMSLKPTIDKVVWPLRKTFKSRKLKLKVNIPDDVPEVEADPIQLRNIMQQILENALVYTQEGGVTIQATPTDDNAYIRIDVKDTGCGIVPEMHEKIFDRFVRGEGSESNDRPDRGIGLGLAIAKQLVEMHGGRIWVRSVPGEGSTFSFTLRAVPSDNAGIEPDVADEGVEQHPIAEAA